MSDQQPAPGRAGTSIGAEEIETTSGEKLLAVVLAIFISIGAVWAYERLDHIDRPSRSGAPYAVAWKDAAIQRHARAVRQVTAAKARRAEAARVLELRREAYRTALDAGRPANELRERYEAAQADLADAGADLRAAGAVERATAPPAKVARRRIAQANSAATQRLENERRSHDRLVFGLRITLLVLLLGGSYKLLGLLRARNSRYVPAAFATIFATALYALVMAADYTGDYIEFDQVGPLAISLAGIVLTLGAFAALQRYLRRRTPLRRVRRGDCPFCGYPVRAKPHCEGCGRQVLGTCSSCQRERRVGAPRCGFCGNA